MARRRFRHIERCLSPKATALWTTNEAAERMANIRHAGTAPELKVRQWLSGLAVRYRTNNKDLPGSPDLANRTKRFAVFVHGCFWHRHPGCARATLPKANQEFWRNKFQANARRDKIAIAQLRNQGYIVEVVWECETKSSCSKALPRIRKFSNKVILTSRRHR